MSNKYTLVIDTETTGLPKSRGVTEHNYNNWDGARLVQVAWELFDTDNKCIDKQVHIIIPNGFQIPEVVVNIHGISTERAQLEGIPIEEIWKKLARALEFKPTLVAHNMQFDNDIILAEMYRAKNTGAIASDLIIRWIQSEKVCTMLMGTLPGQRWPKLIVLYERCFNRLPEGDMHRADNDVRACADIYFHLIKSTA
jgi:DNA polymerase-3 subunit alpha